MEKFFCLASDGLLHFIGQFETWEQAEIDAEKYYDVIWLMGESVAKSCLDTISEHIS